MKTKILFLIVVSAILTACAGVGVTQPMNFSESNLLTKESYLSNKLQNGVVLLDINWGRWWSCGTHENAQLIGMAFDKLPMTSITSEAEPSLVLHNPSRLTVEPNFLNYAYTLESGTYALSAFSIKVADSVSKVGFLKAQREHLYSDGKPIGGTFTVEPGEVVFVGNFYLDCEFGPTLWRYYPDGQDAFKAQIEQYAKRFPYLELNDVKFRLFKTKEFGNDYNLVN